MLKLNRVIKTINKNFTNYVKSWLRCASIEVEQPVTSKTSARQNAWRVAQEKYTNHANILYSSYLECPNPSLNNEQWKNGASHVRTELPADLQNNGKVPKNWMEDYEFYAGATDLEGNINSTQGTADPSVISSRVPCGGCGAHLHCASISLPGYVPSEIFKNRTVKELRTIVCQRCHFLQTYNIALDTEVAPDSYVETISRIRNEYALAIVIVDLLDFPCSIWPGMQKLLGPKRPVFIVGNKVDLLPRDSNGYLDHVQQVLKQKAVDCGLEELNIKYVSLISAKTGYGIEELITQLHKIWLYKGDVYLLGCTNVGKSSLFNILMNSDYCRPEATDLVRKATACPWPGTTLNMLKFPILRPSEIRVFQRYRRLFSERGRKSAEQKLRRDQARKTGSIQAAKLIGNVGRTFEKSREDLQDAFAIGKGTQPIVSLNERSLEYQKAKWCYDTPGVMHPDQITNLLTTEELLQLQPSQMMSPRAFRLKSGMSVFLAGLGRLDFIHSAQDLEWIKILIFSSMQLPVVITPTIHADQIYRQYMGTQVLGVPSGSEERLTRWPGLQCKEEDLIVNGREECLSCDITLSSAGWIGISIPHGNKCTFRTWTPYARGIYMRSPPLIPFAERLIGKRIRNSLAYNMAKPFVFRK